MTKIKHILFIAAMAGVIMVVAPAYAHPGHQLIMDLGLEIKDNEVIYELRMGKQVYDSLITLSRDSRPLQDQDREKAKEYEKETIQEYFKKRNAITIDGIKVLPVVQEVSTIFQSSEFITSIVMSYPLKSKPRSISIVWDDYRVYDFFPQYYPRELSGTIEISNDLRRVVFNEDEPEYIWHSPETRGRPLHMEAAVIHKTESTTPFLVGLCVVALTPLAVLALMLRKARRRTCWAVAACGIVPGIVLYLLPTVVLPMQGPAYQMPTESQAKEIFTALQSNIYRAFDYDKEDDIYDALSQSVGSGLLDEIYNEVYQSLILRDAGGAVARIQSVKPLEVNIKEMRQSQDGEPPAFTVDCRWIVHGAVTHWGHTHARTNQYEAIYEVELVDGAWRIVDAETIEQVRLSPDIQGIDDESSVGSL